MKDELGQRYCKEAEGGRRLICIILLSFLGFIFWGVVFGWLFVWHMLKAGSGWQLAVSDWRKNRNESP